MMRDTDRGFLSGFVGVPRGHPLWGWQSAAIPSELGIDVHGGIGYSRICEHGPAPRQQVLASEARRICHVPPSSIRYRETVHATDQRAGDADVWWFGFNCNQIYDLIPGDAFRSTSLMRAEVGQTYRDDAYVVREVTSLASQLRAIDEDGIAPPRDGPPPPLGLDPYRGGDRG